MVKFVVPALTLFMDVLPAIRKVHNVSHVTLTISGTQLLMLKVSVLAKPHIIRMKKSVIFVLILCQIVVNVIMARPVMFVKMRETSTLLPFVVNANVSLALPSRTDCVLSVNNSSQDASNVQTRTPAPFVTPQVTLSHNHLTTVHVFVRTSSGSTSPNVTSVALLLLIATHATKKAHNV